ncbi:nucleoside recognition domain-containing protein [Domibacillus mangrovi]|uniref:Ferrous iron transporter B n=1 Tax=Domibacillus mangrovi TaxID=1714354 RepID=A0A1Q5P3D0_9BACI|nr:nucleoside recognition domain-containing protein [Domibacillus mangrovi]OKL36755.1 hypothetical protein BLL40_08455 [Domibacillus mangrovi]
MKIVLVGLESSGKTSILSAISKKTIPVHGSNVRGSTSSVYEYSVHQQQYIDTPGIREESELVTSLYTRKTVEKANVLWYVVRGTHFVKEITLLFSIYPPGNKPAKIIVTFEDKLGVMSKKAIDFLKEQYSLPIVLINARELSAEEVDKVKVDGRLLSEMDINRLKSLPITETQAPVPLFEHRWLGPAFSLLLLLCTFALPVFISYRLSSYLELVVEQVMISPILNLVNGFPNWLSTLLVGDYGLLSLGMYSFVWAFPIVLLFSLIVALTDESGLKDRITDSLDPFLRKWKLTGHDLVPIISGFGCNVVAIQGSRSCHVCSRKNCISVISFGSACSYQMGATLSVFAAAGHIELILPYLFLLAFFSLVHVRIWNRNRLVPVFKKHETYLQFPSGRTLWYRIKPVIQQFILQAMPIFLVICLIASLFSIAGILRVIHEWMGPIFHIIGLSEAAAPAFVASIFRKDGILLLNEGGGELLASLTMPELLIAVYLCSTFSSCLVTLLKIAKELSWKEAVELAGKQVVTSIGSTILLSTTLLLF